MFFLKPNVDKMASRKNIKGLIKALKHWKYRKAAIEVLISIGEPAVEPLIAALIDPNEKFQSAVVEILGKIKSIKAVEPLIQVLKKKPNPWLFKVVMNALGNIGDSRAVEYFIWYLKNLNSNNPFYPENHQAIIDVLKKTINPQTFKVLVTVLIDEKSTQVQEDVIEILQEIFKEKKRELIAVFKNTDQKDLNIFSENKILLVTMLKNSDKNIRKIAAQILKLISVFKDTDQESLKIITENKDLLFTMLKDSDIFIRKIAAEILEPIGIPKDPNDEIWYWIAIGKWDKLESSGSIVIEPLIAALHHADGAIRTSAAKTLGKIGDFRAVESLLEVIQDNTGAMEALGELGDNRAVKPLLDVCLKNSNNFWTRKPAAEALVNLYHSGKLDDQMKKLILSNREQIIGEPYRNSEWISNGRISDCTGEHVDEGISEIKFPI